MIFASRVRCARAIPRLMLASALAGCSAAYGFDSEPQRVHFADSWPVFDALTVDTGYLPSKSDPISVRFTITPTGGIEAGLDAESHLAWPDALTQQTVGVPGTGTLAVDSDIAILAEAYINLWIFQGSVPLWTEHVTLHDATAFDPLALGGPAATVTPSDPNLIAPWVFDINVITGIDLALSVAATPTLTATLAGDHVHAETTDGGGDQTTDAGSVALALPPDQPGELGVSLAYVGDESARLDLVLEPSASLDTWIGNFTLVQFPIPVTLVDTQALRAFTPAFAVHPLPALGALPPSHDFGEVAVGGLATWDLPVQNDGELLLTGEVTWEGDGFSAFPDGIAALPRDGDGLTVSFSPPRAGAFTGELVLTSNDPGVPTARIALSGFGQSDETTPATTDVPRDEPGGTATGGTLTSTCGCASAPGGAPVTALAIAAAALARRRRSAPGSPRFSARVG